MTRRYLALGLATAMLTLGGMNAWSASVNLGTLVSNSGTPAGTFTVGDLSFSEFTYTANADPLNPSPPPDTAFTVVPAGSTGITFTGAFLAGTNQTTDYHITYKVTTTDGSSISNGFLSFNSFVGVAPAFATIAETIHETSFTGPVLGNFSVSSADQQQVTSPLTPPSSTLYVVKDILINGGSATTGANLSDVTQAFNVNAIPEPTSMALLGIGLTGLFTFRRFFKRAFVT